MNFVKIVFLCSICLLGVKANIKLDLLKLHYHDVPNKMNMYTNSWAVEVNGGKQVADDIARKHGFINKGQVSIVVMYNQLLTSRLDH